MPRLNDPLADASDQSPLIDKLQARRRELLRKEKQNERQRRKALAHDLNLTNTNRRIQ